MTRYRWVPVLAPQVCPDGRRRQVYLRQYRHKARMALRKDGSPCLSVVMRNRRLTGRASRGRFTPDDTPAARRAMLEAAAPLLLEALQRACDFLDANYRDYDMPDILPFVRHAIAAARGRP